MKKVLISCISIIMLSALILTGCGDKDLSIKRLFDDLKTGNIEDARSLIVSPNMESIFGNVKLDLVKSDLGKEYYSHISFDMSDINIKDDTASATVKFTYPDMEKEVDKASKEVSNGKNPKDIKDFNKLVISKVTANLKSGNFEKKESNLEMRFEKGINEWLIKDNNELNNIIFDELNLVNESLIPD
ncbi:MAG: hypothetical protein ACRDCB_04385 [Clostridium sp.]